MARPAVFLDKDGTLIEDVPYNVDPARIVLAAGAAEGLRMLSEAGFRLAVASNQSGIARGYFAEAALAEVEVRLRDLLNDIGVSLDGFFYCPHHPAGSIPHYAVSCDCRKPAPGLLLAAGKQLGVDLDRCWMVGDILDDIEAGQRAGCRTVLINNGNETEWLMGPMRSPHFAVNDLLQAAQVIVRHHESRMCLDLNCA